MPPDIFGHLIAITCDLSKKKNYLKISESLMSKKKKQNENLLKIKRARLGSLNIFEVTEAELEIIEKGSPTSIYLNFAIFLLTIASQSLITLLTVKGQSTTVVSIFAISCGVGFLLGSLLLILWYQHRGDFTKSIRKIRDRLKTE